MLLAACWSRDVEGRGEVSHCVREESQETALSRGQSREVWILPLRWAVVHRSSEDHQCRRCASIDEMSILHTAVISVKLPIDLQIKKKRSVADRQSRSMSR